MQSDMHYYGTYCMARAAGIKKSAAQKIAYASQFVDNSTAKAVDDHENGSKLIAIPTAHHPTDLQNIDREDQRYIWVPFHFMPGAFWSGEDAWKKTATSYPMWLQGLP